MSARRDHALGMSLARFVGGFVVETVCPHLAKRVTPVLGGSPPADLSGRDGAAESARQASGRIRS